ncbi:IclR family transcriptional regulator [Microbacterium protaetiae]|uniref:IclR family transcriptional regulator n=1 Tax=Microbacterium protaetiae TaxID=2509458 RepID=A0A4P6EGD7_9MICO|nr:IclR family transcriptional regulator [Microbacterium protaetiae]QAY59217.1 IclR family transcriptional regulator [Microbacterium protaetiae]
MVDDELSSAPRAYADRHLSAGVKPLLVLSKIREILDTFTLARPMLTLGEIRARTGIPASTVQRLVSNLVAAGFLDRDDDRYGIGLDFAYWASAATQRLSLVDVVTPVLKRLRDETGETASMFQAERLFRVCVAMAETRHAIRRELHIGKILPLHAGSSGRVLMAWDDDLAARALAEPLERLTDATITDPAVLREELQRIRAQGFAVTRDEQDDGAIGISAPVFGSSDVVIGAVSLSGPTSRISDDQCAAWADLVVAAADQATRLLGGRFTAPQ